MLLRGWIHPESVPPLGTSLKDLGRAIRQAQGGRKPDTTDHTFLAEHCGLLARFWQDRSVYHHQTFGRVHAEDFTRGHDGRRGG
jgi:hypothetical protein